MCSSSHSSDKEILLQWLPYPRQNRVTQRNPAGFQIWECRYNLSCQTVLSAFFFLRQSCGGGFEVLILRVSWQGHSPGTRSLAWRLWLPVGCLSACAPAWSSPCSQQGHVHHVNTAPATKPMQCFRFFFLTLVPWKLPSRLEERRHLGCWFSSLLPACPLLPLPLFGPSCLCTHRILWWCTCVDVSPRWLLFLVKKLVFILRLKQSRGCRYYLPK